MKKKGTRKRDRQRQKKKHGMRIDGRSILDILRIQRKRAEELKDEEGTSKTRRKRRTGKHRP